MGQARGPRNASEGPTFPRVRCLNFFHGSLHSLKRLVDQIGKRLGDEKVPTRPSRARAASPGVAEHPDLQRQRTLGEDKGGRSSRIPPSGGGAAGVGPRPGKALRKVFRSRAENVQIFEGMGPTSAARGTGIG